MQDVGRYDCEGSREGAGFENGEEEEIGWGSDREFGQEAQGIEAQIEEPVGPQPLWKVRQDARGGMQGG